MTFLGVVNDLEPEHRCPIPKTVARPIHTVWRCECGKAYRFERFDPGHDVQAGDGPPVHWVRFKRSDA